MNIKDNVYGVLDYVGLQRISGWACVKGVDDPMEVCLFINDELIASSKTVHHRKRVLELGFSRHGNVGFDFPYEISQVLSQKDRSTVSVRIKKPDGSLLELSDSPKTYFRMIDVDKAISEENLSPRGVLVLGLSKTGTSIATYRIANALATKDILFEPAGNLALSDISMHLDFLRARNEKAFVCKCLLSQRMQQYVPEIAKLYNKVVILVRDPRDRIISNFLYHWYVAHDPDERQFHRVVKKLQLKEKEKGLINFVDLLVERSEVLPFLQAQVLENKYILELSGQLENAYLLKYEDFVGGRVEGLAEFLNVNQGDINGEVDHRYKRVVRSSSSSNWRKWFTEVDVREMKPFFDPMLESLGYDQEWNLSDEAIDPEKSSEYIKKLFKPSLIQGLVK